MSSRYVERWHKFLRSVIGAGTDEIQLVLAGPKNTLSVLERFKLPKPEDVEDQDLKDRAVELLEQCQADCDGMANPCRYALIAMGDGEKRSPFVRLRPNVGDTDDETESEPATKDGLLAQLMRHNEAQARTIASLFDTQSRVIERQAVQIEKHEEHRLETFQLVESLVSKAHKRKVREKEAESRIEVTRTAVGALKPLIPVIAKKLLPGMPAGAGDPRIAIVKGVVQSMTPEQIEKMKDVLTQEQMIAMLEIAVEDEPEEPEPEESEDVRH